MPRINLNSEGAAIAYGAADEVAEFLDRNRGFSRPFLNVTDWFRVGTTGIAGYAYMQNMQVRIAEPVLYAGSTLSVKSVSRLVREGFAEARMSPLSRRRSPAAMRALPPGATTVVPEMDTRRTIKITSI